MKAQWSRQEFIWQPVNKGESCVAGVWIPVCSEGDLTDACWREGFAEQGRPWRGLVLKGPEKQHPDRKKAGSEGGGPRGQALEEEVTPCPMGMSGPDIGSGQGILAKGCHRDMGKSSLRSLDLRWEEEESQDGKARGWGAV